MQDADPIPPCPRCRATHVVRDGRTQSGSPNLLCRGCGRRFVARPKEGPVPDPTRAPVRRLLRERMGLRSVARAVGVSRSWLPGFVSDLYREQAPFEPGPLKKSRATRSSRRTRCGASSGITGAVAGVGSARCRHPAGGGDGRRGPVRGDGPPDEYRDGAIACTDSWSAYPAAVPAGRHAAGGKGAGITSQVERSWCTVRRRCGRFVRKTLSYPKCIRNHVGALRDFTRYYNASLQ